MQSLPADSSFPRPPMRSSGPAATSPFQKRIVNPNQCNGGLSGHGPGDRRIGRMPRCSRPLVTTLAIFALGLAFALLILLAIGTIADKIEAL